MGAVRKRTTATPGGARVRLTHPERVLFSKPRVTKADLADFYTEIAAFILPELINRPLMLLRCPDGAAGPCFFQKHAGRTPPPAITPVPGDAGRKRTRPPPSSISRGRTSTWAMKTARARS